MEPRWESAAKKMLDRRDRFTRPQVEEEFCRYSGDQTLLMEHSIQFDPQNDGYLTPVLRDRYSVVWYMEDDGPVIRAVVPTAHFSRDESELKSRLGQIVKKASGDLVVSLK